MILDWQLSPGVDRGLWDYLHAAEMVACYDEQMRLSPLAAADVAFCEKVFPAAGRLVDLGCGTGRVCLHFAMKGWRLQASVDLSDEMLGKRGRIGSGFALILNPPPPRERERERPQPTRTNSKNLRSALNSPSPPGRGVGGEGLRPSFGVNANPSVRSDLPSGKPHHAACSFSTLGIICGHENRPKVIANAFQY